MREATFMLHRGVGSEGWVGRVSNWPTSFLKTKSIDKSGSCHSMVFYLFTNRDSKWFLLMPLQQVGWDKSQASLNVPPVLQLSLLRGCHVIDITLDNPTRYGTVCPTCQDERKKTIYRPCAAPGYVQHRLWSFKLRDTKWNRKS